MSKVRDISNLSNVIRTDASGNVSFVSGSTTLATINTSGQLSGSSPVLSSSYALNADLLDGLDSTQFTLTSSFAAQTASFTAFSSSINTFTSSLNSFSASVLSFTASQLVLNGTYATTGSNTFTGIQTVNSNLVVTGSITAQTLVVQTITSSVDFVTGSTRFGSSLSTSTHQFTGSLSVTGSVTFANGLTVAGAVTVSNGTASTSTSTGALVVTGGVGIGGALFGTSATFNSGGISNAGFFTINDGTTTLGNSFAVVHRNANDGNGRFSLSRWQVQNTSGLEQSAFIGAQAVTGASNYSPNLILGVSTGVSTYSTYLTIASTGAATFASSVTINQSGYTFGAGLNLLNWQFVQGGDNALYLAYSGTQKFSMSSAGAATFSSSVSALSLDVISSSGVGSSTASGLARFITAGTTTAISVGQSGSTRRLDIFSYGINVINEQFELSTSSAQPIIFNTNSTERMRISSTGAITISTPTSGQALTIAGLNNNWTQAINGSSTTGQSYGLLVTAGTNSSDNSFYVENKAANTIYFRVRGDGQVNVGAYTYANAVGTPRTVYVDSAGTIGGISSILASKTNIKQFDTNWLYDLKPVQFNYRKKDENEDFTDEFDNELYYGLIAEETELINKEICTYNNEKLIGIEYSKLVPVLVKAIQEQQAQINELKAQING